MNAQVQQAFDKAEQQRNEVFDYAAKLNIEQLTFKPGPDSWCIIDVFDHLMTAEKNGLLYMSKKILGDAKKFESAGIKSKLRSLVLNTFIKAPIKFKAPAPAQHPVREQYDFKEVKADWDKVRTDWKAFLENLDDDVVNKLIFKHPMAGRLSVVEALSFMYEHLERHKGQIARIQAHENYPK